MTGKSFSYTPEQLRRMEEDAIRAAREMGVRGGHFGRPSPTQSAHPQQPQQHPQPRQPERKPGIGPIPAPQPIPVRQQQRTPPRQQESRQQPPSNNQGTANSNPISNLLGNLFGGGSGSGLGSLFGGGNGSGSSSGIGGSIDELLKSFGLDADMVLILFLMFILIREEGDFMLILALGYILL